MTDLIEANRKVARAIARNFFIPGAERQDVEQEAMIGLWIAARDWDGTGDFAGWAGYVIRRRLITCIKIANQLNRRGLTESYREASYDGLVDVRADPVEIIARREQLERLIEALPTLTESERKALTGVANGSSYKELGPPKAVDNALQRARGKLAKAA